MVLRHVLQRNSELPADQWVSGLSSQLIYRLIQYDYMYPFGDSPSPDSQVSILFDQETLQLKQIQLQASSLNITNAVAINAV